MRASPVELNALSSRLAKVGIAGFCPTTLSAPPRELLAVVSRIGSWIQSTRRNGDFSGATPLGIHLEGPFISQHACGAHPPGSIRNLERSELEALWKASLGTIKLITFAPEAIPQKDLAWLLAWSKKQQVRLSIGHSRASTSQCKRLLSKGFSGITHAWNAMPFHHRDAGILGAGMGRKNIHLELIIDQRHVSPEVIRWSLGLHRPNPVCMISDCVTSGGLRSTGWHRFGPLRIRNQNGAARLADGGLAGGSKTLSQSYIDWVINEAKDTEMPVESILKQTLRHVTIDPLRALGIDSAALVQRRLKWNILSPRKLSLTPCF